MKKTIYASAIALFASVTAIAQPVSDRAVIPLGVTLTQILRIHVVNGGNIEFVLNDINDFKNGIENAAGNGFYSSNVQIASSTEWELDMGAEDVDLVGTDDPTRTLSLNNVGFTCDWGNLSPANNVCCGPGAAEDVDNTGAYTNNIVDNGNFGDPNIANGLLQYTGPGTCILFTSGGNGNGGDINDNNFTIQWEVGTQQVGTYGGVGTTPMNVTSLLDQNVLPDRYVTNVFLELTAI